MKPNAPDERCNLGMTGFFVCGVLPRAFREFMR
jgi:hypothetical protein